MSPTDNEDTAMLEAIHAFRQCATTLFDPAPGLLDAFLRYETWSDLDQGLPLVDFSPYGEIEGAAPASDSTVSGAEAGKRTLQASVPRPPMPSGAPEPSRPPGAPGGTVPVFSLRRTQRKGAMQGEIVPSTKSERVPDMPSEPRGLYPSRPSTLEQIATSAEAILSRRSEEGGVAADPVVASASEPRQYVPSRRQGPEPLSLQPPTVNPASSVLSAEGTLTMAQIETLSNALLAKPRHSSPPTRNPERLSETQEAAHPQHPRGSATISTPVADTASKGSETEIQDMLRLRQGAQTPFRLRRQDASSEVSASLPYEPAGQGDEARAATKDLAGEERSAPLGETQLTPEALAELVNEALVEQARRHGVDLA